MKIFLSWSGNASKFVAIALRDWLPMVLQEVEPWLSSEDIPMGKSWSEAISSILMEVDMGIICMTRANLNSNWLHFEAGAISKNKEAKVCGLCIDLEKKELSGPLALFQAIDLTRKDLYLLVSTINGMLRRPLEAQKLDKIFELTYPLLHENLNNIPSDDLSEVSVAAPDHNILIRKLDEILALLRQEQGGTLHLERPTVNRKPTGAKPKVFVGSSSEGLPIAGAIQENLEHDAEVTIWTQDAFNLSSTVIESIVDLTYQYDFAILVFTGDDVLTKRGQQHIVGRDNILFELGLFTGALGRARTFLVHEKNANIHLPSDLNGVTTATYCSREDGNIVAMLASVCQRIKRAMGV